MPSWRYRSRSTTTRSARWVTRPPEPDRTAPNGGQRPSRALASCVCRGRRYGNLTIVQSGPEGAAVALDEESLAQLRKRVLAGGAEKYHAANAARGKLFARERIALLVDEESFVEDGRDANGLAEGLPSDGGGTGTAPMDGQPGVLMA